MAQTKTMRKLTQLKKGFTLVELIAVVAVILILVAIVVPRIGDLRGDATNARNSANANIMQGAFERAKVQGQLTAANYDSASVVSNLVAWGYLSKAPEAGSVTASGTYPDITFSVTGN